MYYKYIMDNTPKIPVGNKELNVDSKRNSIYIPVDTRGRSNSTDRRNSISILAQEFSNKSEEISIKHSTNKIQVIVDALIKVIELLKK